MILSFGESIKSNIVQETNINDIISWMTFSEKLKWLCEDIRNTKDKQDRNRLKERLPYVVLGSFKGKRKVENFQASDSLVLDIDNVYFVNHIKNQLIDDKFIRFVYVSPSGRGLKVGVQFDRIVKDAKEYSAAYRQFVKEFKSRYNLEVDNTPDCTRACYIAFDPKLYYNPESTLWTVNFPKKAVFPVQKTRSSKQLGKALEQAKRCNLLGYHDWIRCGFILKQYGAEGWEVFKALSTGKGSKDDLDSIRRKWETFPEDATEISLSSFFHITGKNGGYG